MNHLFSLLLVFTSSFLLAQGGQLTGSLQNADQEPLIFANVALYDTSTNALVKAEATNEQGAFTLVSIPSGVYRLVATYVGLPDLVREEILITEDRSTDLGLLTFPVQAIELATATVKADRALVEIKPDRTVFNVSGTINSAGADALSLLRKAPGVLVDNNDNISVLGRSGVLIYVDGKLLPLNGDALSAYLNNLQADQIDRIDIISNPGAKYDAEGNAGIIDIHLKKDKNHGANGSVNATVSQGRYLRENTGANGNFRNRFMNVFGNGSLYKGQGFNNIDFTSTQNGLALDEINRFGNQYQGYEARLGTDFFIGANHTIGFLVSQGQHMADRNTYNRVSIANQQMPSQIDSVLIARTTGEDDRFRNTFNLNYRYDNKKGRILNIDADYGRFRNDSKRIQPNQYFDATQQNLLTEITNEFDTPTDIDISTFKVDYEQDLWGGKWAVGTKASRVASDNTFLVYLVEDGSPGLDLNTSNTFEYDEDVYAGYTNYSRSINKAWSFSAGLRVEHTDATGNLMAFRPDLMEPPVELNYTNWFPSAGLTWQVSPKQTLALNYGRRINRPDYNVLNPFNNQLSQLSYERGNPFLRPEIVNNLELGYTLNYRYNLKVGYSKTTDQITHLIGPDENDPRANFISWENLAEQTIWSANISAPVQVTKWWNAYVNLNASHLDNQADYGDGAIVDVQAFTYNIYQQSTFTLPFGFKGEISGWFSGPGIWGGVFEYDPSWSLDVGLQRRFLNDQMNVRLNISDIFYESYWSGVSSFNGLVSTGSGNWDSRRVSLSISYDMGNKNVKSRKRKTGLEEEAGRVGSNN
ncbi:MAG: TonB-dependent receptor [Lewinellaceae bacterium]|nr:TonB-dependent receptor [Saprospiraceae bacterium]MCB9313915.1 TonB-dependent receptor [Lewinellaceae bacterium]